MTSETLIETRRLILRPLTVDDATDQYLGWFAKPAARRIASATAMRDKAALQRYIADRCDRDDVLFLGIFQKPTARHIGNVKYEPIDSSRGFAVVGILIGEADARGIGVAGEVLEATGNWLRANRGTRQLVLGVASDNAPAIRAYEKTGFRLSPTPLISPSAGNLTMVWDLTGDAD